MPELKTKRPFQERFLDGFDRSQLRAEVEKVKPKRFRGLRKKYASWALGASLAFGGLGVPMKMVEDAQSHAGGPAAAQKAPVPAQTPAASPAQIQGDLEQAKDIASQVAGGVQAVATGVQEAARAPIQAVAQAPKQIGLIS